MHFVSQRLLSAAVCALVALPNLGGVEKPSGKPSDKVLQYLAVLEKRPSPGYLFDRLYDAWLDTGSAEELQAYLAGRVKAKPLANDILLLAFLHRKEGREAAALTLFKQAVQAESQHTAAWYYKAEVEAAMLDFDAALASVQTSATLASLAKTSDEDLLRRVVSLQGRLLIRCGKRDQALVIWRSLAARKTGDFAEEIVDLAAAEGLLPEAIQDQKILVAACDDPYLKVRRSLRLAELQGQANQRADALAVLDQTLEKVASQSWLEREILAAIERLYRRDDDVAGLCAHLGRLAQGSAARQGLRRRQAMLLMETGRLDEAIAVSATIMAVNPGERRYAEEHAQLLVKATRTEEAATVLGALITAYPKDAALLIRLAEVQQNMGKLEEVKALVKRFAALQDPSLASLQRTARLFERFTCIPEAEAIWRQAFKEFPADAQALEDLAAHLYRFDKKPEAIALWQQLASTDVAGVVRAARALAGRGEHVQSLAILESRRDQHADQEAWFSLYIQESIIADKAAQAQWAGRRWVQIAQGVLGLEQAIEACLRLAVRTQSVQALITELKAQKTLSLRDRCLLAWAYEHDYQAASADALLGDTSLPDDVLIFSCRYRLQRLRQDWSAAAATLEAMLKLPEKTKAQTLRDLVEMHIRAGNHEAALAWIAQWRRSVPGSLETWQVESRLLQVLGKTEESLAVLRRGISTLDHPQELREYLALAYYNAGKFAEAQRLYWRLYEEAEKPEEQLGFISTLATIARNRNQEESFLALLQERRRGNRQSIQPLLALAQAHRIFNNNAERRQALLEASRMQGDNLNLLWEIAACEEEQGNTDAVLTTLERAKTLDHTPTTNGKIVRALFAADRSDEAWQCLTNLASETGDPRQAEGLADLMAQYRDWPRMIAFLQPLCAKHPVDYRLRFLLAMAHEEDGNWEEAWTQFSALFQVSEEIPGWKARVRLPTSRTQWQQKMGEDHPQILAKYLELTNTTGNAYRHRNDCYRSWNSYVVMPGQQAMTLELPNGVKELPPLAFAHLQNLKIRLALDAKDPRCSALISSMQKSDLAGLEPILESDGSDAVLVDLYPDHPLTLTLGVEKSTYDTLSATQARMVLERYAGKNPAFSALAALRAGTLEKDAALLAQAQSLFAGITKATPYLLKRLNLALGDGTEESGWQLNAEMRAFLIARLKVWYTLLQQENTKNREILFPSLANILKSSKDFDAWLALLEDELARESATANQGSQYRSRGYRRNDSFLVPISSANFPPQIFRAIFADDFDSVVWSEPGVLIPLVAKARDPRLRILLAQASGVPALVKESIDQALTTHRRDPDVLVFAAVQAGKDQRFHEAIAMLEELRFLALDKILRQSVDCALVYYAQQTQSQDQTGREAGLQAIRRLARGYLDANRRRELVIALEVLGQSKEARDLQEKNLTNTGGSSVAGVVGISERLDGLIAEGKTDELVDLFVRDLRAKTSGGVIQDRDVEKVIAQIARLGLTQDVLAKLTLTESAGIQQRLGQALILKLLGKTAEARKQYEEIASKNPKDPKVLIQLVQFLAPIDLEAARGYLVQVPEREREKLGESLYELIDVYKKTDSEPIPLFAVATLGLDLLQAIEKPERVAADWASRIQNSLQWGNLGDGQGNEEPDSENSIQSSLFARLENGGRAPVQPPDFAKQQRDLFEGLNRALLRFPKQAHDAFAALVKLASLEKQSLEPFLVLAKDLIVAKPWHDPSGERTVYFDSQWQQPMEFLLRHTRSLGQQGPIFQELLPKLSSSTQRATQRRLESLAILNTCDANSFAATAAEILGNRRSELSFFDIVEIWEDRKLSVDLLPFIIQTITKESASNEGEKANWLQFWLFAVGKRQGANGVKTAIETLCTQLIAPPGARADILAQYNASSQVGKPKLDQKIRSRIDRLKYALRRCAGGDWSNCNPCTLIANAYFADLWPEDPLKTWVSDGVETLLRRLENSKASKQVLEEISLLPFFGSVEGFLVLRRYQGDPFFVHIPEFFQSHPKTAARLKTWLEGQKSSFGRDLVLSLLDSQNQEQIPLVFYELCAQHLPAITALAPNRQRDLAVLGQGLVQKFHQETERELSLTARQGFDFLQQVLDRQVQEKVTKLMLAKSLYDLGLDLDKVEEFAAEVFTFLLRTQPDQALTCGTKLCELAVNERKRKNQTSNWLGNTIRKVAAVSDARALPLIFHLMMTESDAFRSWEGLYSCGRLVEKELTALAGELHQKQYSQQVLLAAAKHLENLVPEQSAWLLGLTILYAKAQDRDDEALEGVVLALETESSPVAKAMAVVFRLRYQQALARKTPGIESGKNANLLPSTENLAALAAFHPWMRQGEPAVYRLELMQVVMGIPWQGSHEALVPDDLLHKALRPEKTPGNTYREPDDNLLRHLIRNPCSATRSGIARTLLIQYVSRPNRNNSSEYPSSPYTRKRQYFHENTDALMFQLALTFGDQAMAQRIAQAGSSGQEIGAIATVLTAGSASQAAQMFHKNWRGMQANPWGRCYTPALEKALPAFLEALENPQERLVAEAWILGLPDGKGDEKPANDRSNRLKALANRVPLKTRILTQADLILSAILLSDVEAWRIFAPRLHPFAQHWNTASLRGQAWTDQRLGLERRLWGNLQVQRFLAGDDALVQDLDFLARIPNYFNDGISDIRSAFFEPLQEEIQARCLNPYGNEVFFTRILALETVKNDFPAMREIVLSLLAIGRGQEVKIWYQNLSESAKTKVQDRFSGYGIYFTLGQMVSAHNGTPGPFMADKERVCLRVLSDPTFAAMRGKKEVLSSEIFLSSVLEKEELKDLGFKIARLSPRQGRTWIELAQRLKESGQFEAESECYLEASLVADSLKNQASWTIQHLSLLDSLGRSDEARQKAKNQNISTWPPAQQERWKKLVENLGKYPTKPQPKSATKALIP